MSGQEVTAFQAMKTDIDVTMDDVVSAFVSQYEDNLFGRKKDLTDQIRIEEGLMNDLVEEVHGKGVRAQTSIGEVFAGRPSWISEVNPHVKGQVDGVESKVGIGYKSTSPFFIPRCLNNLASGQIGGAVLDVFDPEPLPADDPLWSTPGIIVTPHISADDGDAYVETTLDLVFRNLRRYLAGEALENRVNPDLGY